MEEVARDDQLLHIIMKIQARIYNLIREKVQFLYKQLDMEKRENKKGRKLKIHPADSIALGLYWKTSSRATKKSLWKDFEKLLRCSYKTLVVNINRFSRWALYFLTLLLKLNRQRAHLVKYTDSTDMPVCLNKNARNHRTMEGLASWGKTGKGWFFGLKLHITCDFNRRVLAVKFSSGNVHDQKMFLKLNKGLFGIFVADAAYLSAKLQEEFFQENRRMLFAKPRANMKKLATSFQNFLYGTRMTIEANFRVLKQFFGLTSSLPRSVTGHLANYAYALTAYLLGV